VCTVYKHVPDFINWIENKMEGGADSPDDENPDEEENLIPNNDVEEVGSPDDEENEWWLVRVMFHLLINTR